MFDPDLNAFLQSFQRAWLTAVMLLISAFGSTVFLTTAAAFILFCIHFRKGLFVLHAFLWSSLLTDALKEILRLPRPTDVDPSLSLVESQFPKWLMDLFPLGMNPGFPSGHVCSTTVFWGAVMFLFPGTFPKIAGTFLILTMPVSRMYLGRHFLVDVLGGFILAALILLAGRALLLRGSNESDPTQGIPSSRLLLGLFVLPLFAAPYLAQFQTVDAGKLLGLSIASLVLLVRGLLHGNQDQSGGLAPYALAAFLYISLSFLLEMIPVADGWFSFLRGAIPAFVSIWATVEIINRIGLSRSAGTTDSP